MLGFLPRCSPIASGDVNSNVTGGRRVALREQLGKTSDREAEPCPINGTDMERTLGEDKRCTTDGSERRHDSATTDRLSTATTVRHSALGSVRSVPTTDNCQSANEKRGEGGGLLTNRTYPGVRTL